MSAKRGDRAQRPDVGDRWLVRFGNKEAAKAWGELSNAKLATGLARLYDILVEDPRWMGDRGRHHQLQGEQATGTYAGRLLERWQHEISSSGRVWFLIDDEQHTSWLVYVGAGHPSATA